MYVTEASSGVHTITGVATSIAAFVGRADRGPTNEPITINSFGDFERLFGGMSLNSTLGYAVRDFYRNGGSRAVIVRLHHAEYASDKERDEAVAAAQATATAATGGDAATTATAARTKADSYKTAHEKSAAEHVAKAAEVAAAATPTPADVKKAADDAAKDGSPAAKDTAAEAKGPDAAAAAAACRAKADTYTTDPDKSAAKAVADAAEAASTVSEASVKAAADSAAAGATPKDRATLNVGIPLVAVSPGAWGNNLRARVDHDVAGDAVDLFNLSVRDGLTGTVENHRNLSVTSGHVRRVDKVLANESRLIRVTDPADLPPTRPAASADLASGQRDVWGDHEPATNAKVEVGGMASDGGLLGDNDFIGSGKEQAKEGLYALSKVDLFNLLCVPPYLKDGNVDQAVVEASAAYCEQRRAMLLVDPQSTWVDKDAAKAGVAKLGLTSKNAALYFPRLRQPDPLRGGQMDSFVPCGAVAGVMARTDTERGVWKAPAGIAATLVGVPELNVPLTDAENGELNPLGVNCLRAMPAAGRVVWGARTMRGDDRLASEWKYVPVRRTALFIEESLYRGTHWVVFEPNDEPLWAQIRLNLGSFMHNLFRQGAFQGSTPQDAYFVRCDKDTTTQNDIDLGIVNILVGFAPLKPAEFVVITIQQLAGQIQA
ncbi:phage tail sheath family protein [Pseudarthrobacter sp. YS3]|uniref:phage tail sheath family protein n=1 Tax=Pseudarthrobacter sp. YS3 TaxID=3453718 RepID=UPI003F72EEEE